MVLTYKDTSVFYDIKGGGQDILFLHGFLESSTMWDPIIDSLKTNYRCITVDLLGHGQTGNLANIHTMELMADAVYHVLKHLESDQHLIVAHSMGGYVSLAYAERFPDKMKGLCLINSTALPDSDDKKIIRKRAVDAVKSNKRIFISMAISNLFASQNLLLYNEEINKLKTEAYQLSKTAICASLLGMRQRPDRTAIVTNLDCKKLVVLGKDDPILELKEQLQYLRSSGSEIIVLEGGHMPQIEIKYELTYIIKQFIELL